MSLTRACKAGDLERVLELATPVSVNKVERFAPPLHYAVSGDSTAIVDALLARGADVDGRSRCGVPPLVIAVSRGDIGMTDRLLRAGANLALRDRRGWNAVDYAARYAPYEMLRHLLEAGGRAKYAEAAVAREDSSFLRALLKTGASASPRRPGQFSPLRCAAKRGDAEAVRLLLEAGADPGQASSDGQLSIHAAAAGGDVACIRLLLAAGAAADAPSRHGGTPPAFAARCGRHDAFACLMACAPGFGPAGYGQQLFVDACAAGWADLVPQLLERGFAADGRDCYGRTPLHLACARGHYETARCLLEAGADPNAAVRETVDVIPAGALPADLAKAAMQRARGRMWMQFPRAADPSPPFLHTLDALRAAATAAQ